MNASEYPLLTSLARTQDALTKLGDSAEVRFAQRQAESVLESLGGLPVRGAEKLTLDGASSLPKFLSLLSELRFASMFVTPRRSTH